MAEVENNKPKTEKTSASVTSTLPRLYPTTKLNLKGITCNIPKLKRRCPRSRQLANDKTKSPGLQQPTIKTHPSKFTGFKNSDQLRFSSNDSLPHLSPRNYHGQIPVLQRHSLNVLRMSPPVTRSPSPIKNKASPKEPKTSQKIKTIKFEKKTKTTISRSPSPSKKGIGSCKKAKQQQNGSVSPKAMPVRRPDPAQSASKRVSKAKVFSSSNVLGIKGKPWKEAQGPKGDAEGVVLKQSSQPSLGKTERVLHPQEKISLDHIKNEVCTGDHRRLSYEKVHVCIEKTVENLPVRERKHSYLLRYSTEDLKQDEDLSMSLLQNLSNSNLTGLSTESERKRFSDGKCESKSAIRTLSGHELVLTPSMNLDIEKGEIGDDIEISQLLNESGENFEEQKDIDLFQDDANEYDSEVSTDGEMSKAGSNKPSVIPGSSKSRSSEMQRKSTNSLWRNREADILNDVDYRQSVYHPTVSRRQNDVQDLHFKPKSKSIEDNYGLGSKPTEKVVRCRSSNLRNKYSSQRILADTNSRNRERSWGGSFERQDSKHMFNPVIQGVPIFGVRRVRSKKERVSVALLRLTQKLIRLLAIFNFWPGDNCYLLTSQSLKCANAR